MNNNKTCSTCRYCKVTNNTFDTITSCSLLHRYILDPKITGCKAHNINLEKINIDPRMLWELMDTISNASFATSHREKIINCIVYVLQDCKTYIYPTSTFGVKPRETANTILSPYTGLKYNNWDIYPQLLRINKDSLKKHILKNVIPNLTKQQKKLIAAYI